MVKILVTIGDVVRSPSAGLITTTTGLSHHPFSRGVDRSIDWTSGEMFHCQLDCHQPLNDGQIIHCPRTGSHNGMFDCVLFIVDHLQKPLYELLMSAFKKADQLGLTSISMPVFRTCISAGGPTSRLQSLDDLARAVTDFAKAHPTAVSEITIAVHDNVDIQRQLKLLIARYSVV